MTVVIEQLGKRYGDVVALDRVDATIRRGSFTTLLGPSGSGKTTLLMCLAGFVRPSHGRVLVDGSDITDRPPEKRDFGVVFQGYALFPHLSVARNIGFPLRMRGRGRAETAAAVERMLKLVQMEGYGERRPAALSGGQQQRVALARALAFDPSVVLLDEPLSALDRALREALRTELRRIHDESGATFVMVTHDQEEALSLSDHVILLNEGGIVQQGAPQALYHRPATLFAARFVGQTNLIPVHLEDRDGALVSCRAADGSRFAAPAPDAPGDGAWHLSVRPESIRLDAGAASDANRLAGTVFRVSFEGFDCIVSVDTALGPQQVRLRARGDAPPPEPGAPVTLAWPAALGHLVPGP